MERLQEQLVLLQYWIASQGLKVAVVFEGRGSAGKGGVIKRITERTSPRTVRVVALPKPTERERTQWYFQRYVEHLPAAGEMVLFDRSWYNRSNVEWVMGYCTEEEHQEFLRSCPEFERMLVRSGIIVLKYWFSVSFEEQRRRFEARNAEPLKRWKLSDMDLAEHELYVRYSMAKDTTFQYTDIKQAPWYVVPSDDKRASRLNCISHLLSQFDYVDVAPDVVELPTMREIPYVRPPMHEQTFVPRAAGGPSVTGRYQPQVPGAPLNGPHDPAGDPAAVEAALLRQHDLAVDGAARPSRPASPRRGPTSASKPGGARVGPARRGAVRAGVTRSKYDASPFHSQYDEPATGAQHALGDTRTRQVVRRRVAGLQHPQRRRRPGDHAPPSRTSTARRVGSTRGGRG